MATDRYACIHGHFYQPPRENPWLEAIEQQDSAHPYHDWNERITEECYGPNGSARLLDHEGWLLGISNNYSKMSFNFGPTLLSWMEEKAPDVYQSILEADRLSIERFSGHGSAIAQAYSHLIMPLASVRDQLTQVRWGIRDFEHRFGRKPEGMWLAETAACIHSLEALAECGIAFTILAPRQVKRYRKIGDAAWTESSTAGIDPTRAYLCRLPSGRSINLFFYDGPVSQGVAFEQLLNNGEVFAHRISDTLTNGRQGARLAHIATDGETYGHHHKYGEMALAFALHSFEQREDVTLTNYSEFLSLHPPEHEVEIHENSSWSCVHGIERWRSDCGCSTGGNPGWNQAWRAPLRSALDFLRDALADIFEERAAEWFRDPWRARDDYIHVILDRSPGRLDAFLSDHAAGPLNADQRVLALRAIEMQRHAMLMYTSCGWFFDDLGGLETVQVLQYAARAIQLAQIFTKDDLEEAFLRRLENAWSNPPHRRSGRQIYDEMVRPAVVDLARVGAHYAVSTLFDDDAHAESVYCYNASLLDCRRFEAGRAQLCIGRVCLTSKITTDSDDISFAVLHLGDHIINGGARHFAGDEQYSELVESLTSAFDRADFGSLLGIMDRAFGTSSYSLGSLFADEQRRIVDRILADTMERLTQTYTGIHRRLTPLMRFLSSLQIAPPRALTFPAEFVVHNSMIAAMQMEEPDPAEIESIIQEARKQSIPLSESRIAYEYETMLIRLAKAAAESDDPLSLIEQLGSLVALLEKTPEIRVNLAGVQLTIYRIVEQTVNGFDWDLVMREHPERMSALKRACQAVRVRHPRMAEFALN
ncbi:MAG: DUF3536 domain-containing protein [Phycisphaeraceae bacterium]|nr:MAG: DUF3536 domain-containing protein [Phycisphaeraceae bacterium]